MLLCCLQPQVKAEEPVRIHVSIPPQKFLVERIGGNRVDVAVLLKQGMSPESYEPTPRQMARLNSSSLYFRIGVPFEEVWIKQVAELNPELAIIPCCGSLGAITHDHSNEEQYLKDTHVWTSPDNAKELARIIRDVLIEHDEVNTAIYSRNFDQLAEELDQLDLKIKHNLDEIRHRYLIVSHPSWGHFAERYHLNQVPIERHGSELRARELARLVNLINATGIKVIYVQPQYKTTAAKVLARETGASMIEIDPLAENYIENLEMISKLIREGNNQ